MIVIFNYEWLSANKENQFIPTVEKWSDLKKGIR